MLIVLLVIIGLSLLILGHEAGHFAVAKIFGMKVDEFGFGFPPRIWAKKKGDTEYSVNWLPFGGFVRIAGENGDLALAEGHAGPDGNGNSGGKMFYAQAAWKKGLVVIAGVLVNFLLGWFLISASLAVATPKALIITDVQKNSPAAAAGFLAGDAVKGYVDSQSFIDFVNAHRGEKITVTLLRQSRELQIAVTPRMRTGPNEGAIGVVLGEAGESGEGIFAALGDGFTRSVSISWLTVKAFYALFKDLFLHGSLLQGVVGPVGIFGVAEETGKIGLIYLVELLSVISINLAVVNLIPFPALDGGRFFMVIVEKIKGSPIPRKLESAINGLGFAFLIVLMILLTVRDVRGLFF